MRRDFLKYVDDGKGNVYYECVYNEFDKNHKVDQESDGNEGIIAATPDSPDCPVRHIKRYLDLLHPDCQDLFQRPRVGVPHEGPWYCNEPVGKNELAKFMSRMSEEGELIIAFVGPALKLLMSMVLVQRRS